MDSIKNWFLNLIAKIPNDIWFIVADFLMFGILVGLVISIIFLLGRHWGSIPSFLQRNIFHPISNLSSKTWSIIAILIAIPLIWLFKIPTTESNSFTEIEHSSSAEAEHKFGKHDNEKVLGIIEHDTLISISNKGWYLFNGHPNKEVNFYTKPGAENIFRIKVKHSPHGRTYNVPEDDLPASTFKGRLYVQSVKPQTLIKLKQVE